MTTDEPICMSRDDYERLLRERYESRALYDSSLSQAITQIMGAPLLVASEVLSLTERKIALLGGRT